jgi:predicted alpha/beta hydrolase family esterase
MAEVIKKAVILHAMGMNSKAHWYPWLKAELVKRGYTVWVPDMPSPNMPNVRQTTDFLLANKDWNFTGNVIIGHSWGAVQALHLLQNLPSDIHAQSAVLVSSFDHPAPGMEAQHKGLFTEPFDFKKIKEHARQFLFVHSSNDPYVPLASGGVENLAAQTGGQLIIIPDGQHFSSSLDPAYVEFPGLLDILVEHHTIV